MMNQIKKDHSQVFEFVDVPSEPVYFDKTEKKQISERILRDCDGHSIIDSNINFTG